jgi:hypothetical protein
MRHALFISVLGLAGVATAQIPLPPFVTTYTAAATRGYWWQMPPSGPPGVIVGASVPNEAAQAFQVVEIIDLGLSPPPAFPATIVGTQLFYSNNTPAASMIPCAVPLTPGNYYGVLGACTSSVGNATSYNSYGANGPFTSSILGNPVTLTRFGTQFGIGATGGNNPVWQEAPYNVCRVELTIAPLSGTLATNTTLGVGLHQSDRVVLRELRGIDGLRPRQHGADDDPHGTRQLPRAQWRRRLPTRRLDLDASVVGAHR